MKAKLFSLSALVLALFLGGCQSASRLNDVHIGMSKQEIIHLLGTPDSTSAQANIEYMTYYFYADGSGLKDEKPYSIRLVDGKVESFGRFTQLLDVYYRPVAGQPSSMGYPMMGVPANTASQYGPSAGMMPVPVPVAAPAPASASLASELTKLNLLRQQGVLTEDEFQKAKQKLLSSEQK